MNDGDKNDQGSPAEETFYSADYDEDTIDYDLDADKYLEEDFLDSQQSDDVEPTAESPFDPDYEQPVLAVENEYESDQEDDEWYDEDSEVADGSYVESWPLGLIAVGIIALLLLGAGGYGVLQQRTAMQQEIRQLRATLATTTSNTELSASRQAQRGLTSHNDELQAQVERLQSENNRLQEALTAMEAPVAPTPTTPRIQTPASPKQAATTRTEKPQLTPKVAVEKTTESTVAPKQSLPPPVKGDWFVNFGSYSQKEMADHWAARLSVEEGKVVVVSGSKGGSNYYRVRVVDLPNKEIAGKIARQLEKTHKLPRLWVGKQ